jgi:hypothetical protein
MTNAIEHLAEEIEVMEHVNPWARVLRWVVGLGAGAAFAAWFAWMMMFPASSTGGSRPMVYVPADVAPIELREPAGGTLTDPPVRLAWESVTGRLQYIVRVYEKGVAAPVLEQASTAPSFELTPEARAKLPKGKTYVWTVVAQGKNGATIGAGQATFKVR